MEKCCTDTLPVPLESTKRATNTGCLRLFAAWSPACSGRSSTKHRANFRTGCRKITLGPLNLVCLAGLELIVNGLTVGVLRVFTATCHAPSQGQPEE